MVELNTGSLQLSMNPHLKNLDDDFLYHLGYSKSDGLDVLFGDVKASDLWFELCPNI